MLAIAWPRDRTDADRAASLAERMASSLCAGIGGHAGSFEIDGLQFAFRPQRCTAASAANWRPSRLPGGRITVFHGYFDNAAQIAAQLGTASNDLAQLYGLAVDQWGDSADALIVGEYCAVVADPNASCLRLSRSPLRAPPLYYVHEDHLTAAASVPRTIFAAGVPPRLNERRIADGLMRNFSDEEASAFDGVMQVPTGSIVELVKGKPRRLNRWYDIEALPFHEASDDVSVVSRVSELLDEAVRACLAGFTRPGTALSGGLDSPQVAVRTLAALTPGQKLPTFTFHPEPEFDGRMPDGMKGDERPQVEAFAAMHSNLEPHFTDNGGRAHDYRWQEMFHLSGDPAGLPGNYVMHGLLEEAARCRCDVLLLAEWGNQTFSDRGECGFVEYLLTGQWRQLWLSLASLPTHSGPLWRRFASRSLAALLPNRLWAKLRSLLLDSPLLSEVAQPLSAEYRRKSGADLRLRQSGKMADRNQPWNRRDSRKRLVGDGDPAPYYQGLEQLYGITIRDPTAYRPLVEYCLGLPTRMFMRDGQMRWLARQLAKGVMPESQRDNALEGWWDADWHLRIGRRREEWLTALDRLDREERLGAMFDVPRLRTALEDWPDQTETDPHKAFARQLAVPAALVTAGFIQFVEGRNE